LNDIEVLKPTDDEHHVKLTGINPNRTNDGSNNIILDTIAAMASARENDQIITSIHLEFTYIDNPDMIKVEYIPEGKPGPDNR
jgi:hypothetical protein